MEQTLVKIMSDLQKDLLEKMDDLEHVVTAEIHSLSDDVKCASAEVRLTNEKLSTIGDTVQKHEKILYNGHDDGLITQFALLKNDVKKQVAIVATVISLVLGLIMKVLGDLITIP